MRHPSNFCWAFAPDIARSCSRHLTLKIASDPMQKGNFEEKDSSGRPIQIKVAGLFLISYWPDPFVKELRIVRLERI
jgi:hypothetical protein